MSTEVGRIDLGLDVSQKAFNKQLNGLSGGAAKSAKSAFSGLGAKIGVVLGVAAVASFTKSCLSLGSSLSEVQNVVDTTFTTMSGSVNNFASNAMEQFGLSETIAKKYMGTLGAMSKSMGFTEGQSYDMAKAVTGLTGDVASFYNLSGDEAYTKLKSIWTGETESLKDLGVIMTQANLDQYALNNGFGKTTNAMTEQQKTLLRFQYVMSSLSAAQGDFAKTSDSWANQTRILSLRFDSLKATLGQGFISLFSPIIIMINTLLGKLQVLANGFKSFTEAITGKKAQGATGVLTDISSGALEAANDLSGIGNAAESTAKQAEKALAGFDQITKIGDVSGETGTASTATGNNVVATPEITPPDTSTTESAVSKLLAVLEPLRKINFESLKNAFSTLGNSVSAIADTMWDALGWAYTNILVPLAAWTIQDLLPSFLNMTSGALDVFNSTLEALQPLWQWAWDSFLQPLAEWTGGVIVKALDSTAVALGNISDWINNNQGAVQAMAVTVGIFMAAWKTMELMNFIAKSGGVTGSLIKIKKALFGASIAQAKNNVEVLKGGIAYTGHVLKIIASTVATGAHAVATGIATAATWAFNGALAVLTSPITLIILAIAALVAGIFLLVKNWDVVKETAANVWNGIVSIWNTVADWFNTTVIQPLVAFFTGLWNGIVGIFSAVGSWFGGIFSGAWDAIKGAFSGVASFFGGLWAIIKEKFSSIGSVIGNSIGDAFKFVVNSIIGFAENTINGFIKAINGAIGLINKIPGVDIGKLSMLSIPKLAQGGYVGANQPQLAMIGDNKREGEIVSPESKLRQMAIEAAQIAGSSGGITEAQLYKVMVRVFKEFMNITFYMGDEDVARHANKGNEAIGRMYNN